MIFLVLILLLCHNHILFVDFYQVNLLVLVLEVIAVLEVIVVVEVVVVVVVIPIFSLIFFKFVTLLERTLLIE